MPGGGIPWLLSTLKYSNVDPDWFIRIRIHKIWFKKNFQLFTLKVLY